MKKLFLLLFISFLTGAVAAQDVKVRVNGQLLDFTGDQPPTIVNNRTMVPASRTYKAAGFDVFWNGDTREVTVVKGINRMVFTIDSRWVKVSNDEVQDQWFQMHVPAMIMNGRTMLPVHAMGDYNKVTTVYWNNTTRTVNVQNWDELYTGITWLGRNGDFQKYTPGEYNPHYSPGKPTVLYIHGWQAGSVDKGFFPDLRIQWDQNNENLDVWSHNVWIDKGYNVGIFHWTQLADEPMPYVWDAEAKIWNADNGRKDMRWRRSDGSFESRNTPNVSVGQLLFDSYVSALGNHNGGEIRIVGHSLGTQLATRLTRDLSARYGANSYLVPDRVALIDPAFTSANRDYLRPHNNNVSISTAGLCARYGQEIADAGVALEFYRSTALNNIPGGDSNRAYQQLTCFVVLKPWYTDDIAIKHSMPARTYFWSLAFEPPPESTVDNENIAHRTGNDAPSAATPTWRIRNMMGPDNKWTQIIGNNTVNPNDDWFEIEED